MKKNPSVSVLVPIYNVEPYLQRCIDSVLNQDFTDWELILVDDGSPDRCPEICDRNAAKHPDKIKVVHKDNGGLVSARQAGVKIATGEYYVFWDSDDTVPPNALTILYNAVTSNGGYDVVRATGKRVSIDGKESELEPYSFQKGEIIGTDAYLYKQFVGEIPPYLWNAIYKAALFDNSVYEASIKNDIKTGEDWVTNLIVGTKIKKALVIDNVVYYYYYNPASMMGSTVYSNEYQEKVDAVLLQMGVLSHPAVRDVVEEKACKDIIIKFFVPELNFSLKRYKRVCGFLDKKGALQQLKKSMDNRFLWCIKIMPVYYLYSRVYCLLLKYIKLRGKKRRVI